MELLIPLNLQIMMLHRLSLAPEVQHLTILDSLAHMVVHKAVLHLILDSLVHMVVHRAVLHHHHFDFFIKIKNSLQAPRICEGLFLWFF
jgi:hypothetical protein